MNTLSQRYRWADLRAAERTEVLERPAVAAGADTQADVSPEDLVGRDEISGRNTTEQSFELLFGLARPERQVREALSEEWSPGTARALGGLAVELQ